MARILMVVRPSKGGAFGHVRRLGLALAERGHEVAVCGPHGSLDPPPGLEVIHVDINRSIAPRAHARSVVEMAKAMRRFEPDLIHAHGSQGGVVARLARVALPARAAGLQPAQLRVHQLVRQPARARRLPRDRDRALAAGDEGDLRLRGRAPAGRVGRLAAAGPGRLQRHRPVRGARLRSGARAPRRGRAAGRLRDRAARAEGCADADRGMAGGARRAPGSHASRSPATGRCEPRSRRMIARLGVGASVRLLGQLDDVTRLLRSGAVVGRARLGRVVSVRDPGGDGRRRCRSSPPTSAGSGRRSRTGSPAGWCPRTIRGALAAATVALIDDRETAKRLGAAARRRALERFSFAGMVNGTLAVYDEIARL